MSAFSPPSPRIQGDGTSTPTDHVRPALQAAGRARAAAEQAAKAAADLQSAQAQAAGSSAAGPTAVGPQLSEAAVAAAAAAAAAQQAAAEAATAANLQRQQQQQQAQVPFFSMANGTNILIGHGPGIYTPPGWSLPVVTSGAMTRNADGNTVEHRVQMQRRHLKFTPYVPLTPSGLQAQSTGWCRRYEMYIIDEMKRGATRSELTRELINSAVDPDVSKQPLIVPSHVVNDDGDLSSVPPRISGLDVAFRVFSKNYREAEDDLEEDAVAALEHWTRPRTMTIRQGKSQFEYLVFRAFTAGKLQWSDNYKARELVEKMMLKPDQVNIPMSRVDGDYNQCTKIDGLLTNISNRKGNTKNPGVFLAEGICAEEDYECDMGYGTYLHSESLGVATTGAHPSLETWYDSVSDSSAYPANWNRAPASSS